ncbi:MAG: phosphoglucosamine mutase [Desulfurococcaceae archaeon]
MSERKLFGTDGIRGIINVELNPQFLVRLALAIGSYFQEGSRVLIGMDSRAGGEAIKGIIAGTLIFTGLKVYDAGYTPTPALQYAIKSLGFDGGVMVTASHNPPEYNGIKVIGPHGIEVDRDEERKIEELFWEMRYRSVDWRGLSASITPYHGVNDIYVDAIVEKVDKDIIAKKGFKVLVDPANNVGALTTPKLLRRLGVKPLVINGTLDIEPARLPEPTPETLRDTAKIVAETGCILGVGHDSDADRALMIDEKGRVFWGDRSATLLAKYLKAVRNEKGKVYTAVSSSMIIEEVVKPLNVDVVWLKVGSVDIAHAMFKSGDAMCGFEENGGFMYPPHQYVRDGGMKTALFLEMLAKLNARPSELFDQLPRYHVIKAKYNMPREMALRVIEMAKDVFKDHRQITIDGVKVISSDYWVLIRPSGTEPLLRVMIEARSEELAIKLREQVENLVKEVSRT